MKTNERLKTGEYFRIGNSEEFSLKEMANTKGYFIFKVHGNFGSEYRGEIENFKETSITVTNYVANYKSTLIIMHDQIKFID